MKTTTTHAAWKTKLANWLTVSTLASACASADDGNADPSSVHEGTTTAASFDPGEFSTDDQSSGEEPDEAPDDDQSNGFIDSSDAGGTNFECDPWAQDCPMEYKCMPWDHTGAGTWNATRCSPLAATPQQPGDECVVEGSGASGLDDCDTGSMCWDVDIETNTGVCVAFCSGGPAAPSCDNPGTTCSMTNGGVLNLCLPTCDPLVQDCIAGQGCYPIGSQFVCVPDTSGTDSGGYGSPCEFVNACSPGLFCAPASAVPGCVGSTRCCSEFCDLSIPDPEASCSGAADGQACVPAFGDETAPPGAEDIGLCALPA